MSNNYYNDQESVANIAVGLMKREWKVYGYSADESDSMTDYWSPARWGGVAEKNGFVLLVDVYGTGDSGRKVTKQGYTPDWSKINKLQATIDDVAATENEKAVCQNKIDAMMNKQKESTEVIQEYPTFTQGNPKGCNWHIEKDGEIIAKGKGAFQCDGYLFGGYEVETMKKVNKFIDKIEKHISGMGQLVPVQKEVIKKVTKPIETKLNINEFVKNKTIIKLNSNFTGGHGKGTLLQLIEVHEYKNRKLYTFVKLGKKYQQLKRYGAANNTLMLEANNLEKWLNDGSILTMVLEEVEEVTYKTVYKKAQRKGQEENLLQGESVEEVTETNTNKSETVNNEGLTVELIHNEEKNGIELKFNGKPSEGTRLLLKENGFRWSKYKKVWFKKNNEETLLFAESFASAFNDIDITDPEETCQEESKYDYNSHDREEQEETEENNFSEILYNSQPNHELDLQYFATETQENEIKGSFTMDSLLDKFNNVTIENDNRISESDKEYCERQENLYNKAIQVMEQTLDSFNEIFNSIPEGLYNTYRRGYIEKHEDIRHVEDRIKEIHKDFVSDIVGHFNKVYNITLDYHKIYEKYKDKKITYQNIIDEIFEQLGGFNFNEKAVKELKDKIRNTIYRDDKITIKKTKLSISDFVYWNSYSWSNETSLSWGDGKVTPLFRALSHFETESMDTLGYYEKIYNQLTKGDKTFDIFSKYDLGFNKVNSIKFYKNGKIDIVFQSNEQAQQFKNEYLIN